MNVPAAAPTRLAPAEAEVVRAAVERVVRDGSHAPAAWAVRV